MVSTALFTAKAPGIMRKLMKDFGLTETDAAAILGNIGAECAGFTILQEVKPLVPGSRGGWGWCQWTGPRRRQFEAWVDQKNLKPDSDEANYGFLAHELRTSEAKAIPSVKNAPDLRSKVIAFERNFERAGIPHYDSRVRWAERAIAAYRGKPAVPPAVKKTVGTVAAGGAVATGAKAKGASHAEALLVGAAIIAAVVVAFLIFRKRK